MPTETWIRFIVWCFFGCLVYFGYSYQHSALGRQQKKMRRLHKFTQE